MTVGAADRADKITTGKRDESESWKEEGKKENSEKKTTYLTIVSRLSSIYKYHVPSKGINQRLYYNTSFPLPDEQKLPCTQTPGLE